MYKVPKLLEELDTLAAQIASAANRETATERVAACNRQRQAACDAYRILAEAFPVAERLYLDSVSA